MVEAQSGVWMVGMNSKAEDALIGVWMVGVSRTEDGDGKDLAPYGKNSRDEGNKPCRSAEHRYGVLWTRVLVMPKIKF